MTFEEAITHFHARRNEPSSLLAKLYERARDALLDALGHQLPVPALQVVITRRDEFDFSWVWMCDDCDTYLDLADTARALNLTADADGFLERSRLV